MNRRCWFYHRIVYISLVCMCIATALYAQDDETWFVDKPIENFEFNGTRKVSKFEIKNAISEYLNKNYSSEILSEILGILYDLDLFTEIVPEAKRGPSDELIILFTISEKPSISKISFVGNKKIGKTQLQSNLTLRTGDVVQDKGLDDSAASIKEAYFKKGYPDTVVTYETNPDPKNPDTEVEVQYFIVEGNEITIADIQFTGNTLFSTGKLMRTLVSKKRGILNRGTYSEVQIAQDRLKIELLYQQEGYIDAQVVDVIEQELQSDEGLEMTIQFVINEGVQFFFKEVTFTGNVLFTDEELQNTVFLKKGDVLDLEKFQRSYSNVQQLYANEGFIFNRYELAEDKDSVTNEVSYEIIIQEFTQSHIEDIVIQGNFKTKDYVIKRELGFSEGEVFNARKINNARLNLLNLQYFDQVLPDFRPGSADGLIDLVIQLNETNFRDVQFGATFGSSDNSSFPVSAFVKWNEPNFLGRGFRLSSQLEASSFEQSLSLSFLDPKFLNSPIQLSSSVGVSHELINDIPQDLESPLLDSRINYDSFTGKYVFTKDTVLDEGTDNERSYTRGEPYPGVPNASEITEYNLARDYDFLGTLSIPAYNNSTLMNYDVVSLYFTVGSGYAFFSPFGRVGTSISYGPYFNYVIYDPLLYRAASPQIRANRDNWRLYNIVNLRLYYDVRDRPFIPSQGAYVNQKFNFYGGILFGDSHFIRSETTAEFHLTLFDWQVAENWAWKMVFAGQTVFSVLLPQFYYPSGKNYDVDGPTYSQRLSLNGIYNSRGWPYRGGGEATWNNWVELRTPLAEEVVWFDMFFETARLWIEREALYDDVLSDYQFSFGAGFRFVIQQFPIRIYFAKRFSFDSDNQFQWERGGFAAGNDLEDRGGFDLIFSIGTEFF